MRVGDPGSLILCRMDNGAVFRIFGLIMPGSEGAFWIGWGILELLVTTHVVATSRFLNVVKINNKLVVTDASTPVIGN